MSRLERQMDPGGERDYIDAVDIHAGDPIRAQIDGTWYSGTYEASWRNRRIWQATFYYTRDGQDAAAALTTSTLVALP